MYFQARSLSSDPESPKEPMNKPARTPWRRRPRKYLLATQQVRGRLRQAQQHLDPSLHSAFGDFDKALGIETRIQDSRQLAPPPDSPLAEISRQPQVLCPADFKHNLRVTPKKAILINEN
ncbi:hypothetical protein NN561_012616 [Cricetulus griseus]